MKTSSPKGIDAHLRATIQSKKKWIDQFFRRLRAANSVVRGQIWLNFKLIQAHMYVIISGKYEKDFIKNNREKSGNMVFQIITLSVAMETSGRIWPNFELIQVFMHDLIACKYEKDQMKNSGENVMTSFFSIISQWDFFQTLKGSQLRSPWSDLAEFRTHSSFYVYHCYLQV